MSAMFACPGSAGSRGGQIWHASQRHEGHARHARYAPLHMGHARHEQRTSVASLVQGLICGSTLRSWLKASCRSCAGLPHAMRASVPAHCLHALSISTVLGMNRDLYAWSTRCLPMYVIRHRLGCMSCRLGACGVGLGDICRLFARSLAYWCQ